MENAVSTGSVTAILSVNFLVMSIPRAQKKFCEPTGTRTQNQFLKRELLYQLSYRPYSLCLNLQYPIPNNHSVREGTRNYTRDSVDYINDPMRIQSVTSLVRQSD